MNPFEAAKFEHCTDASEAGMFTITLAGKDGQPFVIATTPKVAAEMSVRVAEHLQLSAARLREFQIPRSPETITKVDAQPQPTDRGHRVIVLMQGDRGGQIYGLLHPEHARQFAAQLNGALNPKTGLQ